MLQPQAVDQPTLALLRELAGEPALKDFFLVGGTALALQIGHRKSIDLDFFTCKDFDPDLVIASTLKNYEPVINQKLSQTLLCTLRGIKVDFIRFHYPPLFDTIHLEGIPMLSPADIAPMKLDAITGRGSKKDFFDLYFLLDMFSMEQVLELYQKKFQHQTIFHVIRSLTWFEDAESDPDPVILNEKVSWFQVKSKILSAVKDLI